MQIRVSARNTTVSDQDHDLIVEKIERLEKYLPGMEIAEVHFSEERNPRIHDKEVCEVTIEGHGHAVRAKANGVDHLTAVDLTIEKLENKMHRLKTKLERHRRGRERDQARQSKMASVATEAIEAEESEALAREYKIVKSKTVEKLTLTPLEAALRMDLVGHGFYFFSNSDTGRAAVVYRRDDGDVGLIDEGDAL